MNSLYTAEGVMDKHSLWQRYVPLVRHEALRLQVRLPASVELDDLLQAGGIGLLNAVERYDALQGTAFTTYAVQRIRGAMLDELRSRDWVPRSVRRNAREVAQAIGQLEQELGRNATETEVAERLGIDIADYRQMLLDTNNSQLFSYDEWREEHGDSIELVTDDHQRENPLQQLLDSNLRQRVMEAIETLPEREKLVLTLYYQEELNLKEIGSVLEVGESRVSQLHSQAIKRLRTKTADVKIIMLTVHTENPLPAKVMQAGAAGYLSKGAAPQEVVSAIRSVYSGQRYIASDIAQQMALSQIEPEKTESPFASLSERELQIMLMITKGQKVNEISEQLNLSPKTVNSYRYRMFSKLNIHGDVELTHLAIRHGLCNAETLSSQ